MTEHAIQNAIRNALAPHATIWRANVGQAWAGDATKLPDGRVVLTNPRPFSSGLPRGFADLFGFVEVEITEAMVGARVPVFVAVEVKTPRGRVRPEQRAFLQAVESAGGVAVVARSADDAVRAVTGAHHRREDSEMTAHDFIRAMDRAGWAIPDAARELGVSVRTVYNWRTGRTPIPHAVVRLLGFLAPDREGVGHE